MLHSHVAQVLRPLFKGGNGAETASFSAGEPVFLHIQHRILKRVPSEDCTERCLWFSRERKILTGLFSSMQLDLNQVENTFS